MKLRRRPKKPASLFQNRQKTWLVPREILDMLTKASQEDSEAQEPWDIQLHTQDSQLWDTQDTHFHPLMLRTRSQLPRQDDQQERVSLSQLFERFLCDSVREYLAKAKKQ